MRSSGHKSVLEGYFDAPSSKDKLRAAGKLRGAKGRGAGGPGATDFSDRWEQVRAALCRIPSASLLCVCASSVAKEHHSWLRCLLAAACRQLCGHVSERPLLVVRGREWFNFVVCVHPLDLWPWHWSILTGRATGGRLLEWARLFLQPRHWRESMGPAHWRFAAQEAQPISLLSEKCLFHTPKSPPGPLVRYIRARMGFLLPKRVHQRKYPQKTWRCNSECFRKFLQAPRVRAPYGPR